MDHQKDGQHALLFDTTDCSSINTDRKKRKHHLSPPYLDLHTSPAKMDHQKDGQHALLFDTTDCSIINTDRKKRKHHFLSPSELIDGGGINIKREREQHGGIPWDSYVDILIEILSRLPGSCLSKFRFVCKLWLSLITSDPVLAKMHLDRGFKAAARPSILILSVFQHKRTLSLMDADGEGKHTVLKLNRRRISPSCNGLICVYGRKYTPRLLNPSTGQQFVLPQSTIELSFSDIVCFLAYLPTTEQYKVSSFYFNRSSSEFVCEILTVGTSSWRKITPPDLGEPSTSGAVIKGILYCKMISHGSDIAAGKIMLFDFRHEMFDSVQLPKPLTKEDTVLDFEGYLCVAVPNPRVSIEIWLLEDLMSKSWNHRYTVSTSVFWGWLSDASTYIHPPGKDFDSHSF